MHLTYLMVKLPPTQFIIITLIVAFVVLGAAGLITVGIVDRLHK